MKITTYMKNFIKRKETKDLINSNSFETLYHSCYIWNRTELTKLLAKASINPLPYLERIPSYFCKGNLDITIFKVPKQAINIDSSAFSGCKNLVTLEFENDSKLESIDYGVFEHTGLSKVTLPKSVVRLGVSCFKDCFNLTHVDIEAESISLYTGAFQNDKNLKEIRLPHLSELGSDVFCDSGIEKIYFKDSLDDVINAMARYITKRKDNWKTAEDVFQWLGIKEGAKAYFGV